MSFIFILLPVEEVTSNKTNNLPKNRYLMCFFDKGEQQWKITYKKNKKLTDLLLNDLYYIIYNCNLNQDKHSKQQHLLRYQGMKANHYNLTV
jgi:hypothetical protein